MVGLVLRWFAPRGLVSGLFVLVCVCFVVLNSFVVMQVWLVLLCLLCVGLVGLLLVWFGLIVVCLV